MEADWASWGSFISRLLGSNISEAVKGVEIYHVTNMPRFSYGLVICDAEKKGGVTTTQSGYVEADSNAKSESLP